MNFVWNNRTLCGLTPTDYATIILENSRHNCMSTPSDKLCRFWHVFYGQLSLPFAITNLYLKLWLLVYYIIGHMTLAWRAFKFWLTRTVTSTSTHTHVYWRRLTLPLAFHDEKQLKFKNLCCVFPLFLFLRETAAATEMESHAVPNTTLKSRRTTLLDGTWPTDYTEGNGTSVQSVTRYVCLHMRN